MIAGDKFLSRCIQIAFLGMLFAILVLIGCSRPRKLAFHAPTVLQIAHPESLSDSELRAISRCEYWGVCIFEKYEEVESFGPTYLYQDRNKFIPRNKCRFDTCDYMEAFYYNPSD